MDGIGMVRPGRRRIPYSKHFDSTAITTVLLLFGSPAGWAAAKDMVDGGARNVLLLPADDAPEKYLWPRLNDRSVILMDYEGLPEQQAQHIAQHVLRCGATEVMWSRETDDVLFVPGVAA